MKITLEDADVRACLRILTQVFGCPCRAAAEADVETHRLLQQLTQELQAMSASLQSSIDQLKADVAAEHEVNASAIALIEGFSQRLAAAIAAAQAAGATPAMLADLADLHATLGSDTPALAAAVAANTPAAPPTP